MMPTGIQYERLKYDAYKVSICVSLKSDAYRTEVINLYQIQV